MKNLYAVILAGGSGTRLWPISRTYYPKQFLKIIGNETLIQRTFTRLKKIIPPENIYVTTNRIFIDEIINQIEEFGFNKSNIIIQPTDKNTGPAIAQASKRIFDKNDQATIVTCPSDHLIQPESEFISYIKAAYKLAGRNLLVTFGIKPKVPTSEYGYILPKKSNSLLVNSYISYKVEEFIEKPDTKTAEALITKGAFWNSGIFIWKAKVILNEINKYNPDLYQASEANGKYFSLDSISVDRGILEKSDLIWILPVSFDWEDIGSWQALYKLLPKDPKSNVINNRVVSLNCRDCLIFGVNNRFVSAINLKDLIIVDTPDCVLVANRNSTHQIKSALKQIETGGLEEKLERPLVTIITPSSNDYKMLESTIISVLNQSYKNIEYIVVDGGSTDGTIDIINKYKYRMDHFSVMPNSKVFEKINKGIELSNGNIIGILRPGDSLADSQVIEDVALNMEKKNATVSWGDLAYVSGENTEKISMYWKSSSVSRELWQQGWHPPHPTFFARRKIYKKYGYYNTRFTISADYELMLRLLEKHQVKSSYIPRILVKMRGKGLNWKSIVDRIRGNIEFYKAWGENGLKVNPSLLLSKNISKIVQFWQKADSNMLQ